MSKKVLPLNERIDNYTAGISGVDGLTQTKLASGFCHRFIRNVEISYLHIVEEDHKLDDGHICAEAKLYHTCLERDTCPETSCAQNNFFGQQYLQIVEY